MRVVSRRSWRLRDSSGTYLQFYPIRTADDSSAVFPFKAVSLPDDCEDVHTLWGRAVCARVRFVTINQ